jgi:stearoyl-CoA desaturase (delta-9 desaturase)
MPKISWNSIYPTNCLFLGGTLLTTLTAVPLYIWHFGLDPFQICLFLFFFISKGMSITLGYHRLFSHLTFKAAWPVRVFTLLFGAAAFESSALTWCADHRRHHKFVDHDDDPYDISRGFFHAHIGWLLFRRGPETPLTWVRDLQKDNLLRWQHEFYVPIAFGVGFLLPTLIGWFWGGWQAALGGFLLAGTARIVFVHHMTFCINSLCHWIGRQPYSSRCSAKDSALMAVFTFGEGYHNYHHEFQHDYRNGVKPWQFDPTKWTIWLLAKLGLVRELRTVADEKILRAEISEQQRRLVQKLETPSGVSAHVRELVHTAQSRLDEALTAWEAQREAYRVAISRQADISREHFDKIKRDLNESYEHLQACIERWREVYRMIEVAA